MTPDIVIGIDSSTTTTKAIAWDAAGKNIAEGRGSIPLNSPQSNFYEQDPKDWWRSTVTALQRLTQQIDKERIVSISIANQRETFVALDKAGESVRPAIIWLDERCKDQVDKFAGIIGEDRIHQITGKPKDYAPVVYWLAWMKEYESELFRKTTKFCDVHAYLVLQLTGLKIGTAVVAGGGDGQAAGLGVKALRQKRAY